MAVLVTCEFDGDPVKMKVLSYIQQFLYYKSMGKMLVSQGQVTPKLIVLSGQT